MNKTALIIRREYLTRVRKKSFIIMSILGPLIFAAIITVPVWLATSSSPYINPEKIIGVIDESGYFKEQLLTKNFGNNQQLNFVLSDLTLQEAKQKLIETKNFGYLHIAPFEIGEGPEVALYAESKPSLSLVRDIETTVENNVKDLKLQYSGITEGQLAALQSDLTLQTISLAGGEEKRGSIGSATLIGYFSAFLIYGFIFLYGSQVMRGVIEEKSSRIIEIIISSVKPFQLMMGKILGVASVGLTQFMLWLILTLILASFSTYFIAASTAYETGMGFQGSIQPPVEKISMEEGSASPVQELLGNIYSVNMGEVIICFLFYFLAGYLFYSALFAAVGATSDSDTDSQQFMLPVAGPLILSIVTLPVILQDPHGSLAFWFSIIPFTAPVSMMMRIPFDVPVWELVLSMVMMVAGFLATTWAASKIYKVGILVHGSKINFKTLGKWLMRND